MPEYFLCISLCVCGLVNFSRSRSFHLFYLYFALSLFLSPCSHTSFDCFDFILIFFFEMCCCCRRRHSCWSIANWSIVVEWTPHFHVAKLASSVVSFSFTCDSHIGKHNARRLWRTQHTIFPIMELSICRIETLLLLFFVLLLLYIWCRSEMILGWRCFSHQFIEETVKKWNNIKINRMDTAVLLL